MSNEIDLKEPVYQLVKNHPDLIPLLVDLGFEHLADKKMRNTVGRVVSLKRGSQLMNIPIEQIKRTLIVNGYTIKGDD